MVKGDVVVKGEVERDLVSILGPAVLSYTAEVGGVVVLVGSLKIESAAEVGGVVVTIRGLLQGPSDFSPGGDLVSLASISKAGAFAAILYWLSDGLRWGRPIIPHLPWLWASCLFSRSSTSGSTSSSKERCANLRTPLRTSL